MIGQRIRKFRKAHTFSQEELAEMVGISTTHMSHIETGNTKLSLAVLVNLAFALDVSTDDILFDHPTTNNSMLIDKALKSLEKCTTQELKIILDLINASIISLRKHL